MSEENPQPHNERAIHRLAIFLDVGYLPHLDQALRALKREWSHPAHPPAWREIALTELQALRADLSSQIAQHTHADAIFPPE